MERVGPLSERPPRLEGPAADKLDGAARAVHAAVAAIARKEPSTLDGALSLRGDLGFDSLMLLELLVALEAQVDSARRRRAAERVQHGRRRGSAACARPARAAAFRATPRASSTKRSRSLDVPPLLREAAMHWMGRAQMGFYDEGAAHEGHAVARSSRTTATSWSRPTTRATSTWGSSSTRSAATARTSSRSPRRTTSSRATAGARPTSRTSPTWCRCRAPARCARACAQAGELLEHGKTVLIFPEGTRSADGEIHEFKPVGRPPGAAPRHRHPAGLARRHASPRCPRARRVLRRRDVQVAHRAAARDRRAPAPDRRHEHGRRVARGRASRCSARSSR